MSGMEWSDYEVFHPVILGSPKEMDRAQARVSYKQILDSRPARNDELARLVARDNIVLGVDDPSIVRLNSWFLTKVSEDPEIPGRLLPEWYSVVLDIGLFLGGVAIARNPNLRWELDIWGKRSVTHQHHVIMGFDLPSPHFSFDFQGGVATVGYRAIGGLPVRDNEFVQWLGDVDRLNLPPLG